MNRFARAVVCFALTLAGGGAFAQVNATDTAFQKFYAQVTGVGKQTIAYGSGGQLVVGQGVPQISSAGGPVLVDRSVPVRNNSGGQIAANARVSVPPAVLGRILRAGLAATPILGVGVALYDVAVEAGFTPSRQGGELVLVKPAPTGPNSYDPITATSPAGVLSLGTCPGSNYMSWVTPGYCRRGPTTCRASDGGSAGVSGPCYSLTAYVTAAQRDALQAKGWFYVNNAGGGYYHLLGAVSTSGATVAPPQPSTIDEFEAAIAAKSGWPSGSRVSQAVADATALQPAEPFPAVPLVTGPATSPGTTTTTENPDGSTTTTTTTHNHTYTGPTINTTTQTISSTCTAGSCNTTRTTETPKLDEQPFTMPCGVPGTPACAVKVDETGMPTAESVDADRLRDLEDENRAWIGGLVAANPFPDINWAFELPTACGVIPTPAFAPAMESVDVCQFQPIFHDVMSVVWVLGGLFGAISLFMRNALTT